MPIINTVASMSSHAFGGIYVSTESYPSVYPPTTSSVSPAISGATMVELSKVTLASCGSWTITPAANFYANVKVWGGAGGQGPRHPSGFIGLGGVGSLTKGNVFFQAGVTYNFIVGCGGAGSTSQRSAGAGGGGSGIEIASTSEAIIVAGGGGGGGFSGVASFFGGSGGGTTGGRGPGNEAGYGGTQSAAGAGGTSARTSGSPGSNRNGGNGAHAGLAGVVTAGFGSGGKGGSSLSDSGAGGGGGGYYGGGGGGTVAADGSGTGGGGGSGYYNPTYVSSVTLNATDAATGTAGQVGTNNGTDYSGSPGYPGKILVTLSPL